MSVAIATNGMFWPQAGYGIRESDGIGGGGGGMFYDEQKRKPVATATFRKKRKKRIEVNVSLRDN